MPDEAGGDRAGEAVRRVTRALKVAGVDTPDLDARLLVAAALGETQETLFLRPERAVDAAEAERIAAFAARRAAREPVSRILGTREFYGRPFAISPATLDPRPCTETLVGAVLDLVDAAGGRNRPWRLIDIGTGSGALIVTLMAELPNATGVATDISTDALAIARGNAQVIGVEHRIAFEARRSLEGVAGPFDLLVSNPPYIPAGDIAGLEPDVQHFDPRLALDGGEDGLQVYRELAAGIARAVPTGWAIVEVGAGQARDVERILRSGVTNGGAAKVRSWVDLSGHTRCVAIETHL